MCTDLLIKENLRKIKKMRIFFGNNSILKNWMLPLATIYKVKGYMGIEEDRVTLETEYGICCKSNYASNGGLCLCKNIKINLNDIIKEIQELKKRLHKLEKKYKKTIRKRNSLIEFFCHFAEVQNVKKMQTVEREIKKLMKREKIILYGSSVCPSLIKMLKNRKKMDLDIKESWEKYNALNN